MAWVTRSSEERYDGDPVPPRRYTRKEKAANWWHYHKWLVLGAAAVLAVAVWLAADVLTRVRPDYQVGWVGSRELPPDTVAALQEALAQYGVDGNGDGRVVVQINQYVLDLDPAADGSGELDAYGQMAGMTRLSVDLMESGGSYVFLLEDPALFQQQAKALAYRDGTLPAEDAGDWQNMVYRWADCPVLAGLELGDYTGLTVMDETAGSSQALLADVYAGRRAVAGESAADYAAAESFWQAVTAGASAPAAKAGAEQ